jgi:hypothetical protein
MKRTGTWLLAIAVAVAVLAVCVVVALVVLPWDTGVNVGVGTAAGAVIGAIIPAWVASIAERADDSPVSEQPPALKTVSARVGQIPREPVAYQPRADLLNQLRASVARNRLTVVHALTGSRGVGKTQLAAAYARECLADDWPVVVWLTGETPDQIPTALAELAAQLGLLSTDADTATAAKVARGWLESTVDPALLVVDNAIRPDDISPWLPTVGRCHVVITTTNQAFVNTTRPSTSRYSPPSRPSTI